MAKKAQTKMDKLREVMLSGYDMPKTKKKKMMNKPTKMKGGRAK